MTRDSNAPLAVALGAGGGLLLWYLLRNDQKAPPSARPAPSSSVPCALRLDSAGLTADGAPSDVASAVTRCKGAGAADLVYASDGPVAVYADLTTALHAAGVTVTARAP